MINAFERVRGRVLPEPPYAEVTEYGQALNFDILLVNGSDYLLELTQLEITFVGDEDKILSRRLDRNGAFPAIEAVPRRRVDACSSLLVFNPIEHAPVEPPVTAVQVRATLTAAGSPPVVCEFGSPIHLVTQKPYVLPVAGRVWVWDGHDYFSHHRRWDYTDPRIRQQGFTSNAMRFAYDLVPVDSKGRSHVGDGDRPENYVGFGAQVRAPAAGRVAEVKDQRPDDGSWEAKESAQDPNSLLGNRVIIDHEDGTYSHLAHLQQGSATVAPGDYIQAGDTVASVGNSGSSIFPHLHYQRVDAPTMKGEGVPTIFSGVHLRRNDATRPPVNGHICSGDVLDAV